MIKDNNTIKDWLYNNSWNLIITFVMVVLGFALLKFQVDATVITVNRMQEQLNKYPSEQYFELKFKTQDEKMTSLEKKLDEMNTDLKKHMGE